MSGSFILLASYPKSGNTWLRIVFEKLRHGPATTINEMDGGYHGMMQRVLFDRFAPVNSADLLPDEIDGMFPDVYRNLAAEIPERAFIKVHDAVRRTKRGDWFFPPECVSSAIYLVRHPFDVAVSTANHFGVGLGKAVLFMADESVLPRARTRLPDAMPPVFGSWSENVSSWLDDPHYRVTLARYEDLLADPGGQFERLAEAAGLANTPHDIAEVVEASRFEQLQSEERQHGFRERPKTSPQFFRAGRARSWEGLLDAGMRDQLLQDHGAVMERLGYTADGGAAALPETSPKAHAGAI
jgi:aryl sulfotransferase